MDLVTRHSRWSSLFHRDETATYESTDGVLDPTTGKAGSFGDLTQADTV